MKEEKHPTLGRMWRFATEEEVREALDIIDEIIKPHKLTAEMPSPNIMSRGVQGDEGTYTRVIILKGPNPGWEILQELSTKITNAVPVNRVHFEISPVTKNSSP